MSSLVCKVNGKHGKFSHSAIDRERLAALERKRIFVKVDFSSWFE